MGKKGIFRYDIRFTLFPCCFRTLLWSYNNSARHLTFLAHFIRNAIENWEVQWKLRKLNSFNMKKERNQQMQSMTKKVVGIIVYYPALVACACISGAGPRVIGW